MSGRWWEPRFSLLEERLQRGKDENDVCGNEFEFETSV